MYSYCLYYAPNMQEPVSSNPPSQQVNPQEKKKSKKGFLLLFLFTALLFGGLGILGGKMLLCKKTTEEKKQTCSFNDITYNDSDTFDANDSCNKCLCNNGEVTCTETACDNSVSEVDPYKGWKTYENEVYEYKLMYPSDWEIDTSTAECTDEDNQNVIAEDNLDAVCGDASVIISKDDYSFQLNVWILGRGGYICEFTDSGTYTDIGPGIVEMGEAFELDSTTVETFRRNKLILTDDYAPFRICKKNETLSENNNDIYDVYTDIGEVVYYTPTEVDSKYLEILDMIFYTLEESK